MWGDFISWNRAKGVEAPFSVLQRQMNRLFDDFLASTGIEYPWAARSRGAFLPKISVVDRPDAFIVFADLPGCAESEIELAVTKNLLTIRGERKREPQMGEEGEATNEREFGPFERTVPLPAGLAEDSTDATFKHGVLTVVLPREQVGGPAVKKVPIRSAE